MSDLRNVQLTHYQQNSPSKSSENDKLLRLTLKNEVKKSPKNLICIVSSCCKKFTNEQQLETHMKTHTGIKPFSCEICGKVCKTQNILNLHQDTHKKESVKPTCKLCDRTFSTRSALNKHIKIIHSSRPLKCMLCQSGFDKKEYLDIHVERCQASSNEECLMSNTNHNEGNTPSRNLLSPFAIESSPFESQTNTSHNNHPQIMESFYSHLPSASSSALLDGILHYTCHICSASFPYSSYLQHHMSVHYTEKQPCPICAMPFPTFWDLANHLRTHTVNEQSKMTLDFSNYGDTSHYPLLSFSMSSHQSPLNPLQYQSQTFSHQLKHCQQQQPPQPFNFPSHCQQGSSSYTQSLQYTIPFYSDKRTPFFRDDSISSFNK